MSAKVKLIFTARFKMLEKPTNGRYHNFKLKTSLFCFRADNVGNKKNCRPIRFVFVEKLVIRMKWRVTLYKTFGRMNKFVEKRKYVT